MTIAARLRTKTLSKAAIHSAIHVLLADIVRRYAVAPSIIIVRTAESLSNTCMAEWVAALLTILFRYLADIVIR